MDKKRFISLMVLTFLIILSCTLAYYANVIKGNVTSRSKEFIFNVYKIINDNETTFSDINLYDTARVHNGTDNTIVPGDYGDFIIKVSSKGSELKIRYDINLKGNDIPVNMKFYLDSDKIDKIDITDLSLNGILNLNEEKEYTIYWEWPYESGDNNIYDVDYANKTFTIGLNINGKQTRENMYAISYVGFDNSAAFPSVINKDEELTIDLSGYNYTSLGLKQGNNDLSLDTHYNYENGILKLRNIIDDVTITNLTSFCSRYSEISSLTDCLIATDYHNFRKDKSLTNARKNIEGKKADFSKVEPYLTYTESVLKDQTSYISRGDATRKYYYSTSMPVFNASTGRHVYEPNFVGTIEEIKNNNGYTAFSSDKGATELDTFYRIYEYEVTESNSINITKYDKYSFNINDDYSSNAGLYSIADENNTKSYYYRGEVNNNWLSFGGFYWRILRINGDGSIRVIYSGTKDNHKSEGIFIGKNAFNKIRSSTYVGYMYNDDLEVKEYPTNENSYNLMVDLGGTYYFGKEASCSADTKVCTMTCENDNCIRSSWHALASNSDNYDSDRKYTNPYKYTCFANERVQGTTIACDTMNIVMKLPEQNYETTAYVKHYGPFSKSYEDSVSNIKDSNIKQIVDEWYNTNIVGKNDSNGNLLSNYINTSNSFCNDRTTAIGDGYTYNGRTSYSIIYRIENPSLVCPNENDKFTTSTSSYGNKKLLYPIGILSADEVTLAGSVMSIKNSKYYLYSDYSATWTMTPYSLDTNYNGVFAMCINWQGALTPAGITDSLGIRPVINLNADVQFKNGSGTESDPYVIE